jgi:cell fate (sporulation/competence/biofilm development) regulator YmcA (YheA/YmcA/DUF963 family)
LLNGRGFDLTLLKNVPLFFLGAYEKSERLNKEQRKLTQLKAEIQMVPLMKVEYESGKYNYNHAVKLFEQVRSNYLLKCSE